MQRERLSFTAQLLAVAAAAPAGMHAKRPPRPGEPLRKPPLQAFPGQAGIALLPGATCGPPVLRGGLSAAFGASAGSSGAHGSAAFGGVGTPATHPVRPDHSGFVSGSFPPPPPPPRMRPPPPPPRAEPTTPFGLWGGGSSNSSGSRASDTLDPPAHGPMPAGAPGRGPAPLCLAPGSPPIASALTESARAGAGCLRRAETMPEWGAADAIIGDGAWGPSSASFTLFGGRSPGGGGAGFSLFGGNRGRLFQPLVQ